MPERGTIGIHPQSPIILYHTQTGASKTVAKSKIIAIARMLIRRILPVNLGADSTVLITLLLFFFIAKGGLASLIN